MTGGQPHDARPARGMADRFFCNGPRKVALFAGIAALCALVIGAGFAGISSNGFATPLETVVVRWTAVGCLAIGAGAYVIGGRMRRDSSG